MQPEATVVHSAVTPVEPANEKRAQPWKVAYPQANPIVGYKFEQGPKGGGPKTQGN
jgi:hypothetical protein